MRHFSVEKWADFVNRNVSAIESEAMHGHLEMGCSQCSDVLAQWQSLKQFAAQEPHYDPPQDVLAYVKAAFRNAKPSRVQSIQEKFAQLVFDSFQQPAFAGVRSTSSDSRCLLYRAGPVTIDLNLNLAHSAGLIALQGQVMDSETKANGIQKVPVLLLSGQETIAYTQTNEFGEFQLECDARKNLQISVGVNPQKNVIIVLDETVWTTNRSTNSM